MEGGQIKNFDKRKNEKTINLLQNKVNIPLDSQNLNFNFECCYSEMLEEINTL